jgi:hypothetical protein
VQIKTDIFDPLPLLQLVHVVIEWALIEKHATKLIFLIAIKVEIRVGF